MGSVVFHRPFCNPALDPAIPQIIECLLPRFMAEDVQRCVAQCLQKQEHGQRSSSSVDCQILARPKKVVLEHSEDMSVARLKTPRQLGRHEDRYHGQPLSAKLSEKSVPGKRRAKARSSGQFLLP